MKTVSARQAVSGIGSGTRVMIPPGCGEPLTLMEALIERSAQAESLTLMGGLLLTDYAFVEQENIKFATWHVMPKIRNAVKDGTVEFIPIRYSDIIPTFSKTGPWPAQVILVHASPPDADGFLSLGASVSYPLPLALQDGVTVIAEVNSKMPRTCGNSRIPVSNVDWIVESDRDLVPYPSPKVRDVDREIARHASQWIPDGATLQIGIGSIPEAILECLTDRRRLRSHAMIVDNVIGLIERGIVEKIDAAELMGTRRLWDFVHENPIVNMEPASYTHDVSVLAGIEKFISINSAVEVDLQGNFNAEAVDGTQISGIGGSFDFIQGALLSPGGKSIIAMTSTAARGERSRIVPMLSGGTPITTPRHCADCVITEYGEAQMRGRSLSQRARALIEIAHPKFREKLEEHAGSMGWLR